MIAVKTSARKGHVVGEPYRFLHGHSGNKTRRPGPDENPRECACGCGQMTPVHRGKARLFVHGHNSEIRTITGADYTVEDRGFETPCWIWKGSPGSYGRGQVTISGVKTTPYRAMYLQEVGEPPPGTVLHHRCEEPRCIRVTHLALLPSQSEHARLHRLSSRR